MGSTMLNVDYIGYSDFATGAVCSSGRYRIIYYRKLIDLLVYVSIDFYDLSEHLDNVLEIDTLENDYISYRVRGVAD